MEKLTIPSLQLPPLKLMGSSVAGIATSIAIKELSLCFDVANGWEFLNPIKNILISHGHMDHAGGLPYLLSQKSMTSQPTVKVFMPPSLVSPMQTIINTWSEIEGHEYNYELIGIDLTKTYPLKPGWSFRGFPTMHRVDSNGYTLFQVKKRLSDAFQGLDRKSLLDAKSRGESIEETWHEPFLSFTGDTKIDFLQGPDWVRKSKNLIMEVSFLDDRRTVQEARKWGHIHLDELIENFSQIESEKIIVIHLSKRYRLHEARSIIDKKLQAAGHDPKKVELFGQISI